MKSLIGGVRIIVGLLMSAVWIVLTAIAIVVFSIWFSISDAGRVKSWIGQSGVYERVVQVGVESVFYRIKNNNSLPTGPGGVDLAKLEKEQETLIAAVGEVFPPDWVAYETERNIDTLYGYLKGDQDAAIFSVDLADRDDEARRVTADVFKVMVSTLPRCESGVVGEYYDFDLFSATCLPRNMSVGEMYGIIDNGVAKTIPKDFDYENMAKINMGNQLQPVRKIVELLAYGVVVTIGILALMFVMIWWLTPGLASKVKLVGGNIIGLGAVLFLVSVQFGSNYAALFERIIFSNVSIYDLELVKLATEPVRVGILDLVKSLMYTSGLVCLVGAVVFAASKSSKLIKNEKRLQITTYILAATAAVLIAWSVVSLWVEIR